MRLLIAAVFISLNIQQAFAALTVPDKNKMATVTLHTELIDSSKRVYLAADFEANHTVGLIACKLTVEHKNGQKSGPTYKLDEYTSLLPKESISFNLGLFPSKFHASGLDVIARLSCNKVTYFDNLVKSSAQKSMSLKTEPPQEIYCCRLSPLHLNCAHSHDDGSIDVGRTTQLHSTRPPEGDYSPCYPDTDKDDPEPKKKP